MRHRPEEYPLMSAAHVIAGCDTETAQHLYFSKETALAGLPRHDLAAFFDAEGNKIGEVRIDDPEPGTSGDIVFGDEY